MTKPQGEKKTHQYTLPETDLDKLYKDLFCMVCNNVTSHIFCLSEQKVGKSQKRPLVYACMECASEQEAKEKD